MKFDRPIPGVSETRGSLRIGVGGGQVNKPQRRCNAVGVWWSGWIPRLRFAPRGMTVTELRVGVGGGRVNKPQRRCNAGRCRVVWVDSATALRSARNDRDCASGSCRGGVREKPQRGKPRKPRASPWEPWRSERTKALKGRSKRSLGMNGPPLQGLGIFHGTNFPGRCPGLELGRAFGAATRAGVWWPGWIPRLRFAPRGMTVTALRIAVFNGLIIQN
jgi:hypothetical protein